MFESINYKLTPSFTSLKMNKPLKLARPSNDLRTCMPTTFHGNCFSLLLKDKIEASFLKDLEEGWWFQKNSIYSNSNYLFG
jgi:hypothetical protein